MSKEDCCFDNALTESFFHLLAVDLTHGATFSSRDSAREAVFEYYEIEYDLPRFHSAES